MPPPSSNAWIKFFPRWGWGSGWGSEVHFRWFSYLHLIKSIWNFRGGGVLNPHYPRSPLHPPYPFFLNINVGQCCNHSKSKEISIIHLTNNNNKKITKTEKEFCSVQFIMVSSLVKGLWSAPLLMRKGAARIRNPNWAAKMFMQMEASL